MNNFSKKLIIPKSTSTRELKNEILMGCDDGWNVHFPKDMSTIQNRKNSFLPEPLKAFEIAVRSSVEKVWLIDEYIFIPDANKSKIDDRISTIIDWFPDYIIASDIKILTKQNNEVSEEGLEIFKDREIEINSKRNKGSIKCNIEVNTNLSKRFNYIHDRFAIIDDELWHFGATVGGFHASVTATSRGWNAEETGAVGFFELAWAQCLESK